MTPDTPPPALARTTHPWKVAGLVLLTVLLSVGITLWLVFTLLFPRQFTPVTLKPKEAQVLQQKVERLNRAVQEADRAQSGAGAQPPLKAEPYSEAGASREISLSERELNALLANNTDLAHRLAINLSDNLASAKLLVPLDPEFPILGGKTVVVTAGLELRYANGRPVVILKGVSLWGVPMPNAWLGNLKNIDLVQEFGHDHGFWQAFADGVAEVEVTQGKLRIKLKE